MTHTFGTWGTSRNALSPLLPLVCTGLTKRCRSDLLTGKSLPVLAAIALLPLDASLLGTMVLAGVFGGSCVTLAYAWSPAAPGGLTWAMRFLNLFYSAWLYVPTLVSC